MPSTWRPQQEIQIVAGTPPGGGLDRTARALLAALESARLLDVPAKVVNVAGDGARKAWSHMDQYAGDPHVLSISSPNLATDWLTGVAKFNYDSYTPLAILHNEYIAFVVRDDSRYRSAGDLMTQFAADAGKVAVAVATATGNPNHIALAQVIRHARGDVRAPKVRAYDSALYAVAAVAAGEVDVGAVTAASPAPELYAGRLRALAVSSPTRLAAPYAETPTWLECGVPCNIGAWRGVAGARGLAPEHAAFWEHTLRAACATSAWADALAKHDWAPMLVTGPALTQYLARETAQMATLLDELGLRRHP